MTQYYFSNGQEPSGPFTLNELSTQSFTPTSLVWHEGMTEWQPATEIVELKSLLPVTPPPIRRAPTQPPALPLPLTTPAAISTFSVPPAVQPQVGSIASVPKINPVFIAGGVLLVVGLLIAFVTLRSPGYNDYSVPNTQTTGISTEATATQAAIEQQAAQTATEQQAAAQAAIEQQAAAQAAAEKEQNRAWSRQHFLEFVQIYPNNDYSVGTFGGISAGTFTVANSAGYRLKDVIVAIEYFKPNGEVINSTSVTVASVPARGETVEVFPASGRGVTVRCRLVGLAAPGLDYKYNIYVDETDIGRPD